MLSALKRWTRMGAEESKLSMPSGVKAMGQALQRKFARGVQYNLKIVIKGDRNTGKTCMFHRLQGKPFNDQYIPTNEIQAGSIHWSYKATDDVVKVDVWDVVDIGKSKKNSETLKIENDGPSSNDAEDSVVADANFVDVYKGTHGVIMLFDITKPWTLQYIKKELPKVPSHIPVLVLGNHRDMEEHRLIVPEDVTSFIQTLERPDRSPPIHYAESSMKNGFGLKYIHTFLNFPFLLLQREELLKQLQVNAMDMESTLEELQIYKHTEEQDYDKYLDFLNKKKQERDAKLEAEAAAKAAAEAAKTAGETSSAGSGSPPTTANERDTHPPEAAANKESSVSSVRRWFSGSKPNVSNVEEAKTNPKSLPNSPPPSNIEEFRPEEELDSGFLNEETTGSRKSKPTKSKSASVSQREPSESSDESDSDSDSKNPMVAGFAEDISDDDEPQQTVVNGNLESEHSDEAPIKPRPQVDDIHITSSEEEPEEEEPKMQILQPIPVSTPNSKPSRGLKLDVKGSNKAKQEQKNIENNTTSGNDFDDWLNSPELEPKSISLSKKSEEDFIVRKVDVNSPIDISPPPSSLQMDEWSLFMQQQTSSASKKKPKKTDLLEDSDDEETAKESKHHKRSSEKSHSKKHKKYKDKTDEGEGDKERRKHRHKHKDSEKERKTKDEEGEKKKKSKHKHSKKRGTEETQGGTNYEEI